MNDQSVFTTLNPVAVKTQELNVVSFPFSNFLVESNAVLTRALLSASTIDMIDFKSAFIGEPARDTLASKVSNGVLSSRPPAATFTSAAEFFDSLRVLLAPLLNFLLAVLIDAFGATRIPLASRNSTTLDTSICRISHTDKCSTVKEYI
jgi:hypothetical protein